MLRRALQNLPAPDTVGHREPIRLQWVTVCINEIETVPNEKRLVYETLGVHEYLVYDLGGRRAPDSPRALLLYRLDADGRYRLAQPDAEGTHGSGVFNARIRMQPAADDANGTEAPVFQWYD